MRNSKNQAHIDEKLKDRRDYRAALIEKRNGIDVKISQTEAQIRDLKASA
jgi:hypothetical protein